MALAWLIAIGLVLAGIPFFNRLLSTRFSLGGWNALLFPALLFPVTALLAGIYPALVLSGFSPLKALKGSGVRDGKALVLRKMLTVVQFIIAMALLAGTLVIQSQMRYIGNKDLGIDRSQVTGLSLPADSASASSSKAFCEALRHEAGIEGVTAGSGLPEGGWGMSSTVAYSEGRKREFMCGYFTIDPDFLPLMHIALAEGRNFADSVPSDKEQGFLVNEAFVKAVGWKSAIGQPLEGSDRKGKVVGVMKNFFVRSLHNAIEPVVMIYNTRPPVAVLVKASPQKLPRMKEIWSRFFPNLPFDYFFLDERFNEQYKQDKLTFRLFNAFTALAIFISCLGLYGLVSLIAVQRTKEIGVRKVLGASLPQLISLFTSDLLKLVAWASAIALPIAAIGMHRWLSSFAWHAALNAWIFILPAAAILILTLAVTGLRIIRAALANPVKSLRTD